jgi:signal peptidase II
MSTNAASHTITRTAALVLAVDQLTKFFGSLNIGGSFLPVHNSDYSLGIVAAPVIVLITLSTVTLVVAARYGSHLARAGRIPAWVPGVVVGGAASNLLDRLVFGAVRDFIPTPIVIFNVADIAVLCGLAMFAWSMTRTPIANEAV